jgi:hypothetical protein
MLNDINSGRVVHLKENLRMSISHTIALVQRDVDMTAWCTEHLDSISTRTKALYREHVRLNTLDTKETAYAERHLSKRTQKQEEKYQDI